MKLIVTLDDKHAIYALKRLAAEDYRTTDEEVAWLATSEEQRREQVQQDAQWRTEQARRLLHMEQRVALLEKTVLKTSDEGG